MCVPEKLDLRSIPLKKMQEFSELFQNDIFDIYSPEAAIAHRAVEGGTARHRVQEQLAYAKSLV